MWKWMDRLLGRDKPPRSLVVVYHCDSCGKDQKFPVDGEVHNVSHCCDSQNLRPAGIEDADTEM